MAGDEETHGKRNRMEELRQCCRKPYNKLILLLLAFAIAVAIILAIVLTQKLWQTVGDLLSLCKFQSF